MRKIRIDLGVEISFVHSELLQAEANANLVDVPYFAVGDINYVSDSDPAPTGKILYIKPDVRGSETAADVIAYKRADPDFPNQTTADQWFDEPQLESYRRLGYLILLSIVRAAETRRGHAPVNLAALVSAF